MATSDGIKDDDWLRVNELAIELLGEVLSPVDSPHDIELSRNRLLAYLEVLEVKYGALPSILATRADFVDDYETKEMLLSRAYDAALSLPDIENLYHIAHSLADLYINELIDAAEGRKWLGRLDDHLLVYHNTSYSADAKRFREQLNELELTGITE